MEINNTLLSRIIISHMYLSEIELISHSDFVFPPDSSFSMGTSTPILMIGPMKPGCIIYLHWDFGSQFIQFALPLIRVPFKLITGISDFLVPYRQEPQRDTSADRLLQHPLLLCWFAINKTVSHPKLHSIPIGIPRSLPYLHPGENHIPYIAWKPSSLGYHIVTSMISILRAGRSEMEIIRSKKQCPRQLYIRYTTYNSERSHIESNIGFRKKLDDMLRLSPWFKKEPDLIPWCNNLAMTQLYQFTLEAPGVCLDGYRVWESLLVGTIPIVFSSAIDSLYDDLPVLIISSIHDLTPDWLQKKYTEICERDTYKWEKISSEYWISTIQSYPVSSVNPSPSH